MNNKEIKVSHLIALCHIVDGNNDFRKDIIEACGFDSNDGYEMFDSKDDIRIVYKFHDLVNEINRCYASDSNFSNFNLSIYPKQIQNFYLKYKDIFYTIEKFTNGNLIHFMAPILNQLYYSNNAGQFSYNIQESMRDRIECFNHAYNYILNNQENLDKMLAVLNRIQQLNFDMLEFNKDMDFTNEEMYMYTNFKNADSISYLDNMIVLPTIYSNICRISTSGSNYMIKISNLNEKEDFSTRIVVNSLIFDENRLPKKISKRNTFDKIINIYNEKKEDFIAINKLIELYTSICKYIKSASNELTPIDEEINKLNDIEIKEKLLELSSRIKADLDELKNVSFKIETDLAKNKSISPEVVSLLNKINVEETERKEKANWQKQHRHIRRF